MLHVSMYLHYHPGSETCACYSYKIIILNNCNNFVTLASTSSKLPEDNADTLKRVGLLTIQGVPIMYSGIT